MSEKNLILTSDSASAFYAVCVSETEKKRKGFTRNMKNKNNMLRLAAMAASCTLVLTPLTNPPAAVFASEPMAEVENKENDALHFEVDVTEGVGTHEKELALVFEAPAGFELQPDLRTWKKTTGKDTKTETLDADRIKALIEGLEPSNISDPIEIEDAEKNKGLRTVYTYDTPEGIYTHTVDVFGSPTTTDKDGNEIENELIEEKYEAPSGTKKTLTAERTESITVTPGKIRVSAETGFRENKDESGKTVTIAPGEALDFGLSKIQVQLEPTETEDEYDAVVHLTLDGLTKKEGLTLSVTDGAGDIHTVDLSDAGEDGSLVFKNLNLTGLKQGEKKLCFTLQATHTTKTIEYTPAGNGTGAQIPEANRNEGLKNNEWLALFNYSDGISGLGDAGHFSVFARDFSWKGHSNASVAVENMYFTKSDGAYIGIGPDHRQPGDTNATDYSRDDLCYVGQFVGSGTFAMNNTHSYLVLGDSDWTVTQNPDPGQRDLYKFEKFKDGQVIQTVNKAQGNINNVLKASDTAKINFDKAFEQLTKTAANMRGWSDPSVFEEGSEDQQRVQAVADQIEAATTRSPHGNQDITIDVSKCPRAEDGTYLVNLSIDELEANRHDQFIYLNNFDETDRVLVNVTGLNDSNSQTVRWVKANLRLGHQESAWSRLNGRVMLNFGDYAGTIQLGKQLFASTLAPQATVFGNTSNIEGKMIAKSIHGENEQHDSGGNWNDKGEFNEFEEFEVEKTVTSSQPAYVKLETAAEKREDKSEGGEVTVEMAGAETRYYKPVTPNTPNEPETPDNPENPEKPGDSEKPGDTDKPEDETGKDPKPEEKPEPDKTPNTPTQNENREETKKPDANSPVQNETVKTEETSSKILSGAKSSTKASTAAETGIMAWMSLAGLGGLGAFFANRLKKKGE